jgi:hypothetical protein
MNCASSPVSKERSRAWHHDGVAGGRGHRRRFGCARVSAATANLIKGAESTVHVENFKREMMRSRKYRARDIYPTLSPQLEKVFDEWQRTHPKGRSAEVGRRSTDQHHC